MDITKIGPRILKQNRDLAARQMSTPSMRAYAEQRIADIDAELARRANRVPHTGATAGYVLTATGQFEHMVGEREGFTKCGSAIDASREYGDREWWHCLVCGG